MRQALFIIAMAISQATAIGQNFQLKESKVFIPQKEKVNLYANADDKKLILFQTHLNVNTDGVPISYHPYHLRGDSPAINTILNGVAIYRLKDGIRISNPKNRKEYSKSQITQMNTEAYGVFERWRDSGFNIIQPKGYKIIWENVLVNQDGKPCILTTGKYIGFFASKTALKNDLKKSERGECDCKDQVDPLVVPTLVLAGKHPQYGASPVTVFGARVGDLLVAYNPNNKKIVYAVAGDTGPENNLGEGSVILNMKLKGTTNYPKNIGDTYGLGTKNNVTVCIIPASKTYQAERPYTQENIQRSIGRWFAENGMPDEAAITSFLDKASSQF